MAAQLRLDLIVDVGQHPLGTDRARRQRELDRLALDLLAGADEYALQDDSGRRADHERPGLALDHQLVADVERVGQDTAHRRRIGSPAGDRNQNEWGQELAAQRSISGATMSSDAISATRSATMRPRDLARMMPIEVNEPVRKRAR